MVAVDHETIAAVSTPVGEGAIALVRISGQDAVSVADQVFRGKLEPSQFASHVQHYGEIVLSGQVIDQVLLSVHRAPRSYTGEDVVEISGHGGVLVSARVLEACLCAGARAARAGEFSERAFLNGKMDLTQAEAVMDLIRAQTDLALRSATEQLEGRLGSRVQAIRDELIQLLAHVEAALDFPDENLAPDEGERLRTRLDAIRGAIDALLQTATQGRLLRQGVRVVIYGATNAGKSSLLNRLLGFERAIVSEIPGTTRDTIEEAISIRGIPYRLLDTAGIRGSADTLERAGMARTAQSLERADLVLHVIDASAPKPAPFDERTRHPGEILLLNKRDLPEHADWQGVEALRISCVAEDGLAGLEDRLLAAVGQDHIRAESAVAINTRHQHCLRRALQGCDRAAETLARNISAEYVALDLRAALAAVTEVIGSESDDAVLDSVFAQFCIGK